MHINQHNYEEFFLLYIDGELSDTDRQAVEQFAQANPGFANELEILLQMRLADDEPILFEGKESLFRTEASEINLENHEEHFLLYVDNELNSVSKQKVETFVLQHPALQESFTLLKQTRLVPETIVFPDKSSLYREEKKERPVFFMHWQRIAVAAALIGFTVLVWTISPSDKISNQPTAKLKLNNTDLQKNTGGTHSIDHNNTKILSKDPVAYTTASQQRIHKTNTVYTNPAIENNEHSANTLLVQNNSDIVIGGTKKEAIISNPSESIEKTQFHQTIPAGNTTLANTDIIKTSQPDAADNADHLAQQTVYKELDTEDEKKSLYLGSLEINKDKLRGFFRKAGSLFRGKAKQQEEERTESASPSNTHSLK
jgi:hypothetical protein